ncbi:IS3 family transposase [Streptomyces albidoflavus]
MSASASPAPASTTDAGRLLTRRPAGGRGRLAARIRAMRRESKGTYGVPRITAELREEGEHVNHKRIARLMLSINLARVRLRRRHRTTTLDPAPAKAPDLTPVAEELRCRCILPCRPRSWPSPIP